MSRRARTTFAVAFALLAPLALGRLRRVGAAADQDRRRGSADRLPVLQRPRHAARRAARRPGGERRQGGARAPGQDREGRRQGRPRERQAGRATRDQEERRRGDRPVQLVGRDRQPPDLPEEPGRAGAPDLLRRHQGRGHHDPAEEQPDRADRGRLRALDGRQEGHDAGRRHAQRRVHGRDGRPPAEAPGGRRHRRLPHLDQGAGRQRGRPATTRPRSPRHSRPGRICSTSAPISRRAPRSPRRWPRPAPRPGA